jgi:DNA (cytosine-5)-methyltransferase 1
MYQILDLFSGIGGFSLGLHYASDKFYTSAFCETDEFCQAVLKKNFKNVPIFGDIKQLNEEKLRKVRANKPFIITGGYPCQPFSQAGKRKGQTDPRHLWPEMLRLIRELRPRYVLAENVEGHIRLGLDEVLNDLENEDYTPRTFVIPATGVGANHQRKRIWIIAYTESIGHGGSKDKKRSVSKRKIFQTEQERSKMGSEAARRDRKSNVAHSNSKRFKEQRRPESVQETEKKSKRESGYGRGHWGSEPNVGRVVDGVPFRVDRLKALGNSIVPQITKKIGEAIIANEEERRQEW